MSDTKIKTNQNNTEFNTLVEKINKFKGVVQHSGNQQTDMNLHGQTHVTHNKTEANKYDGITVHHKNLEGCNVYSSNNQSVQRWWKQVMKLYKQL